MDPPNHDLPTPKHLLQTLIRRISSIPVDPSSSSSSSSSAPSTPTNALARIPIDDRPLLATLHVLFPALLLPALDLLDRRRVICWERLGANKGRPGAGLYQIRGDPAHVVHLQLWHCTCPYFALREAETEGEDIEEEDKVEDKVEDQDDSDNAFSTPPCKHLLACLLADQWPALQDSVELGAVGDCSPEARAGVMAS